ncbi:MULTISPECIES: JAB domain-containing protein [unclassified Sphingomonas]|uniref:JAB domain-containing protein n=1 Tax=unclassified Sphingomonas TaxID=196159 RepID=UPI001F598969
MTPPPAPFDAESLARRFAGIGRAPREIAAVTYLDPKWRLLALRHVAGGRSHLVVPLRTVVRDAIGFGAARVVLVHGHPSGDPQPSGADHAYTRLLARTLDAVGVVLFDHLVLAGEAATSMRAMGML